MELAPPVERYLRDRNITVTDLLTLYARGDIGLPTLSQASTDAGLNEFWDGFPFKQRAVSNSRPLCRSQQCHAIWHGMQQAIKQIRINWTPTYGSLNGSVSDPDGIVESQDL